jgi:hypothetical protein
MPVWFHGAAVDVNLQAAGAAACQACRPGIDHAPSHDRLLSSGFDGMRVLIEHACCCFPVQCCLSSSSCSVIQRAERKHMAACAGACSSCRILGWRTFYVMAS